MGPLAFSGLCVVTESEAPVLYEYRPNFTDRLTDVK